MPWLLKFVSMGDTPDTLSGSENQVLKVDAAGDEVVQSAILKATSTQVIIAAGADLGCHLYRDGDTASQMVSAHGAGLAQPAYRTRQSSGTFASPTATASGRLLRLDEAAGHDGTTWREGYQVQVLSTALWSGTERGTKVTHSVVSTGATALTEVLTLENGKATVRRLAISDTDVSHVANIICGSNLTVDRDWTLTLGDQDFEIDLSAITSTLTVSAFSATLLDDADEAAARDTLGAHSRSRVAGLVGRNNTATPATQFDFEEASAILQDSNGGTTAQAIGSTLTNNISTAGSAANGRDQAAAFSNSSWVHFYLIWGSGQSLATLSSASATAPTLPTNYTHKAYLGAVFLDSGGSLERMYCRGSQFFYDNAASRTALINGDTSTTEQTVSVANEAPPNTLTFTLDWIVTGGQVLIKYRSGVNYGAPQATNTISFPVVLPNQGQQFFWNWNGTAGSALYVTIAGYRVNNGGE